jgi:hypothetical protein
MVQVREMQKEKVFLFFISAQTPPKMQNAKNAFLPVLDKKMS